MKYTVTVKRIAYEEYEVVAFSREAAEELAWNCIFEDDWSDKDYDYEIESIETTGTY